MSSALATPVTLEIERMARFLRMRDWTRDVNPPGEIEYTSKDREWQVSITPKDGWWSLGHFTDGDVPNDAYKGGYEARGRYESADEGQGLKDLEAAMVSVGAMEWECPYCGESGGEPMTNHSREWQGDEYHGGMVEMAEEMCSKCTRAAAEQRMKLAIEGF